MKRCNACDGEFEDKFSFCPVDATPLNSLAAAVSGEREKEPAPLKSRAVSTEEERFCKMLFTLGREFRVTMIDNTSLLERLARELRFLVKQIRQAWPA